jgi:hypothetical protein
VLREPFVTPGAGISRFGRFPFGAMSSLLLGFALGCSPSQPREPDVTMARKSLETALDGWVAGESPENLKTRSPAITVIDPEWSAGGKLTSYRILEEIRGTTFDRVFEVELSLTRKGKPVTVKTPFTVGIGSAIVVRRDED